MTNTIFKILVIACCEWLMSKITHEQDEIIKILIMNINFGIQNFRNTPLNFLWINLFFHINNKSDVEVGL